MRSALIACSLIALAAAAPKPQEIDFDVIDNAPPPTVTGPPVDASAQTITAGISAASASAAAATTAVANVLQRQLGVNDPCGPQPTGSGPVPLVDTAAAFLADTAFSTLANSIRPPPGYKTAFTGLDASVNGNVYLGLTTLTAYDPIKCQELCDAKQGCLGFNIFFERDPTLNPASNCSNPASLTNVKCTLWGAGVTSQMATNTGQNRESFQVVIAGSNGYNKDCPPSPCPHFTGPVQLGGAINAPLAPDGTDTYLGVKFFIGPYDPAICAIACEATTAYNHRHAQNGKYRTCNFFAAYVTSINGRAQGLYCSLYSQPWAPSYGTNQGQYRGSDYYSISQAYSYTLDAQNTDVLCDGDDDGDHRDGKDNHHK